MHWQTVSHSETGRSAVSAVAPFLHKTNLQYAVSSWVSLRPRDLVTHIRTRILSMILYLASLPNRGIFQVSFSVLLFDIETCPTSSSQYKHILEIDV